MAEADIVIRPTHPREADRLPEVERSAGEAFRSIPGLAWVVDDDVLGADEHRRLAKAGTSWIALADDRPVGFACAERFGADVHVWQVAVRRDAQGQGIGTRLMQVLFDHAAGSGAMRITLTTFREVPFNEPFYQGLGFRTIEPGDLDERLRSVLAVEVDDGLPAEQRCAMDKLVGGR